MRGQSLAQAQAEVLEARAIQVIRNSVTTRGRRDCSRVGLQSGSGMNVFVMIGKRLAVRAFAVMGYT
ncbi:uncharacterized protein PHALS_11938 [Plasmopara halstedii]|uniref:Uncharacterized protein n=1 Tax=Plasmopara halstedii TaxID=4781 RepID=A0A0N7L5I9_PLAHL|nr:uncharacterized protein PHALS_11938 [Plasmopara halstedii]CEG41603.1 hypothetical protein PHALS_11938 [Plasmopara halstedii]|eukprot:XP_024577972.1 hypothetical protein PHALS_11938 [Plasmopara halstedii]